jgi:predicted nucleic acid-binding protein
MMIIIDSNIHIFSEGASAPEHARAVEKIKDAVNQGRVGINAIIVSEVFHSLQKFLGAVEATTRISRFLTSPDMDYLEFSPASIVKAMALSRDFGIRINDALIAQQAIDLGASVLTDNVKDFKKVAAVKVIPLRSPI